MTCPFCEIVAGRAEVEGYVEFANSVVTFRPLNPVTLGHLLVVPKVHTPNIGADPAIAAATMYVASLLASQTDSCNIITSQGEAAAQTVRHLHVHFVPRRLGDGLLLPWSKPADSIEGTD